MGWTAAAPSGAMVSAGLGCSGLTITKPQRCIHICAAQMWAEVAIPSGVQSWADSCRSGVCLIQCCKPAHIAGDGQVSSRRVSMQILACCSLSSLAVGEVLLQLAFSWAELRRALQAFKSSRLQQMTPPDPAGAQGACQRVGCSRCGARAGGSEERAQLGGGGQPQAQVPVVGGGEQGRSQSHRVMQCCQG